MKRILTALVLVLLAGVSVLTVAEQASASSRQDAALHKRAQRLAAKAHKAYEAGDLSAADRLYVKLRAMKPEESIHVEYHAAVLARSGRKDDAYRALEQAAALGLSGLSAIEGDPELEALRADPRLAEIEERLRRNGEAFQVQLRAAQHPLPAAEAAAHASWAALQEALGQESEELERRQGWPSWQAFWLERSRMEQRHVAAMRHYVDEHANAGDRQDAMLGELRRRIEVASPWYSYWRTDHTDLIRESAGRYLAAFPEGAARNEVLLYRAVAAMRGVLAPDEKWEGELGAAPKLRCAEAQADLEALAKVAPSDKWVADARGFAALCAAVAPPRGEPAALAALDEFLALPEPPHTDRTPFQNLRADVRTEKIRLGGLPEFELTDLDGAAWTPGSLQGKVALIEFWAPG